MKLKNEVITSRANPLVKWASSLTEKKGRVNERCFIAEGEKLTREALEAGLPVTHIFLEESRSEQILAGLMGFLSSEKYEDTEIVRLSESVFSKISTEKAPQGVICVIKHLDFFNIIDIIYNEEFFLDEDERALALYSVRDPGNLGSVIRSAVAFGVDHIILSADSAEVYNPKTVRSAMGSLYRTKITTVKDFSSFIGAARANGRRVLAAELREGARSLDEVGLSGSDIVIIGNEGHGIPAEVSSECDGSVYIPISRKTESLNAAVAAAVFMWEMDRAK